MKKLLLGLMLLCSSVLADIVIDETLHYQHMTADGTQVKYGGVLPAPMKTLPVAMKGQNGVTYYAYTKTNDTHQLFMVADSNGNKTAVSRMPIPSDGKPDFHDAPALRVASDGYIHFVKSARGSWRKGQYWVSTKPYDISEFRFVRYTDWAYPQLWSMGIIYARYDGHYRTLNTIGAAGCDKLLVDGGHYAVSYYDGEYIHVVYNHHIGGDVDQRVNLYYIRSRDGCDWENKKGELLNLPLVSDSQDTLIAETNYAYLKDIDVIDDKVYIAYVDSTSSLPDAGERYMRVTTLGGDLKTISPVCHNYNSGSFVGGNLIYPVCGYEKGYAGGQINIFSLQGEMLDVIQGTGSSNFIRKIINGNGYVYGDTQSSKEVDTSYIKEKLTKG